MNNHIYLDKIMYQNSIKYISFFDTQDSAVKRNYVTSASNKIEYIANTIASLGMNVEIVSMAQVQEDKFKFYSSERKKLSEGVIVKLPLSWGGNKRILRKLKIIWHLIYMLFYLLFQCGKSDTVIVYHSLGYFDIIRWAKKIKKFRLILEVEEIYSDVSKMSSYWRNLEFKMFDIADAFIFSNDLLDKKINKHNKPFLVIYGTYQVENDLEQKFDDGYIHVVYAGTFDPNKGGAQAAISAVEYLPKNYHIHICGFGEEKVIRQILSKIDNLQNKSSAKVTYDGLKKGIEFNRFLQKCHIGLSTQKPDGNYNDTSFPSKILTYMANGLAVVSIKIPVVERTLIADEISFYNEQNGKSISEAILNVKITDNRAKISLLDSKFKKEIKSLLNI